jgi:hypothetical protein
MASAPGLRTAKSATGNNFSLVVGWRASFQGGASTDFFIGTEIMRHETGSTGETSRRSRPGDLFPFDTSGAPGIVVSLSHKDLRVVAFPMLVFNDSPKPIEHHAIYLVVFAPRQVTVLRRHQHQIHIDGLIDFWADIQTELAKPVVGEQQLDEDPQSYGSITHLRALMDETLGVDRRLPRSVRSLFARYRAHPTLRGLVGVEFERAVSAKCWGGFDTAVYEAMDALDDDVRAAAISRPSLSINVIARLLRGATTPNQTRNIQQAIRWEAIGLLAAMSRDCRDTKFGKTIRAAALEGQSLYAAHLQFGFPKPVVRLLRKNGGVWITELQYFVAAQALSSLPSRYWPRDLDEIAAFSELLRLLLSRVNDVEFPGTIIALSYPLPLGLCPNRFLDELFAYLSAVQKMCRRLGHTNVKKLEILRAVDGVWFLFRHRDLASFEKESADIQRLIHHDGLLVTVVSHVLRIPVEELAAPLIERMLPTSRTWDIGDFTFVALETLKDIRALGTQLDNCLARDLHALHYAIDHLIVAILFGGTPVSCAALNREGPNSRWELEELAAPRKKRVNNDLRRVADVFVAILNESEHGKTAREDVQRVEQAGASNEG